MVGDLLENLGSRWDVVHDLPLERGTLDHLVIGPTGVFAIAPVNCRDRDVVIDGATLVVMGQPVKDIAGVHQQADEASALLSVAAGEDVPVHAVLVIVRPRKLIVRAPAEGVSIVVSQDLERFVTRALTALRGDEVAAISDLADLESTWPQQPDAQLDTQRLHRDFVVVRHAVRTALLRRVLWGSVGFLVACAFAWGMIAALVATVITR